MSETVLALPIGRHASEGRFERARLVALRVLALILLLSALLKSLEPRAAIEWLKASLPFASTVPDLTFAAAIAIASAMECAVGVRLLVAPASRRSRALAFALFALIGLVRLMSTSEANCGCFGSFRPPALAIDVLVIAALVVTLPTRCTRAAPLHPTAARCARILSGALALLCVTLVALGHLRSHEAAKTWKERLAAATTAAKIVVVSSTCEHCLDAIGRIEPQERASYELIVSDTDRGELPSGWSRIVRIDDATWWAALRGAPPAFFERGSRGQLIRVVAGPASLRSDDPSR